MSNVNDTTFPDKQYLEDLIKHLEDKVSKWQTSTTKLLMLSSASVNWIGDYISDPHVEWTLEDIEVEQLYLTGTNPDWNKIIIEQAARSPAKLRELIAKDEDVAKIFVDQKFDPAPILIRFEEDKYKVLDGMHRAVGAIVKNKKSVKAYVARVKGIPAPQSEPHVVYDLLRAYHRGLNKDRNGLIVALKFLRNAYSNVDDLLKNRFTRAWISDDEIQAIIKESLRG